MSKSRLHQCKSGEDLLQYAESKGAVVKRQTGSHCIVSLPDGTIEVIPSHKHDLGKGIRTKIVKHLIAAGIALMIAIPVVALCKFA